MIPSQRAALAVLEVFVFTIVLGLAIGVLSGCGKSALDGAILTANVAHDAETVAGDELRAGCTDRYKTAPPPPVAELDRVCVPARKAYGVLRRSRLALMAGIAVARAKGDTAELARLEAELATATAAAAAAVAAIPQETP